MPEYDRWAEKICTIFTARPTLRICPPTEAGHTAVWANRDQALHLITNQGDRALLMRALL